MKNDLMKNDPMNCQPEALSALIDGETTPAETAQLQRHLKTCADCQATYAAMQSLGESLATATPPLVSHFSRTTADFVRRQLPPRLPPTLPPTLWQNLKQFWNHPVRKLATPARRRSPSIGFKDALKIFSLFSLPMLFTSILRDSAQLETFLGVASLGILIGIPLRHFSAEVSLLGSLRRGRCLEEILGTGLSPARLLDVLATQGLGELLKACLLVLPALILGALCLPIGIRAEAVADEIFWLPATAMLFLAGAYATQFLLSWSGVGLVQTLGCILMAAPLVLTRGLYQSQSGLDPHATIVALTCMAVWVGLVGRTLALYGLNHPETVERWGRRGLFQRQPSQSPRHFSANPIARRELARVAQGTRGLLFWRLSMAILPLLWGWWAMGRHEEVFWPSTALFALLIFARSASRTLPAVVREREHRSWELLLQTRLGLPAFVSGWLQVALYTVFFECIFGLSVLLMYALTFPHSLVEDGALAHSFELVLFASLTLLGSSLIGATVGLALSASSENTREASTRLVRLCFTSCGAVLLAWTSCMIVFLPWLDQFVRHDSLDLTWHEAPLVAVLSVGLGLWVWSWKTLRRDLFRLEMRKPLPATRRFTYPANLAPLELAALGALAYALNVVAILGKFDALDNFSPMTLSLGTIAILGAWIFLVRLPLATLAERLEGTRWSLPLGALFGLAGGAAIPAMAQGYDYMLTNNKLNNLANENSAVLSEIARLFCSTFGWTLCLTLGALVGALLGQRSARALPSARRPLLDRRLRFSAACSALALTVCVAGGVAVLSVDYQDPRGLQQALASAKQRADRDNRIPASRNGLTPLSTMLYSRAATILNHDPYRSWSDLGNLYSLNLGTRNTRAKVLADLQTPKAKEAVTEFRQVLPTLDQALDAPEFAIPQALDFAQRVPNFIIMRRIAHDLAGLGVAAEARGDWNEALQDYRRGLVWGTRLSGHGVLIEEMIGIAIDAISNHRLLVLETVAPLTPAQNRQIIADAEHSPLRPENFLFCLETELATEWNFTHQSARARADNVHNQILRRSMSDASDLALPLPEFYLRYERATLANTWAPILKIAAKLDFRTLSHFEPAYPTAILTRNLVPNISRAGRQFLYALTRQEAVRTIAALHLYRHDHGHYPATLDQLVGPYLHSAPDCSISLNHRFDYRIENGQAILETPDRGGFRNNQPGQTIHFLPAVEEE